MHKGWKIAVVVLSVLVVYLGIRDWQRARWIQKELYADWIMFNAFMYDPDPSGDPTDGTKPPPPPPDFGF